MKPSEVQFVKDFYKVKFKSTRNKRLKLFELILKNQTCNNQEACQKIYHHKADSAFCHLKKRLEEDILDFLLLTPNPEVNADSSNEEFKCRKLFMQGKILLARGVYQEGISLLQKTSKIAEKYEFPDIKLVSDDILNTYSFPKVNSQRYERLINKSLNQLGNIYNAKTINYDLMGGRSKDPCKTMANGNTENSVFLLKQACVHNGSKKACYWYQMALLHNSCQKKEFPKAKAYALDLLSFLETEPVICSASKLANVYLSLARILINLKDHAQSITAANEALPLLAPGTLEQLEALEISFFSYFRGGKFTRAESICQQAIHHNQINEHLKRKWFLLHAALKFSQSHFQLVNQTIHRNGYHKSDGVSWLLGQRLLEMLNILELEDYDWFEFKFESFRKKIMQLKSGTSERLRTIYWLLKGLMKSNFDYLEAIQREKDNFNLLNGNNLALCWDPMGYELINVRDWILTKAGKL